MSDYKRFSSILIDLTNNKVLLAKEYSKKETVETPFEPILFTKLVEKELGVTKISQVLPTLKWLGIENDYKLNTTEGWKKAKEKYIQSITMN